MNLNVTNLLETDHYTCYSSTSFVERYVF